jgi:hypothetical protein
MNSWYGLLFCMIFLGPSIAYGQTINCQYGCSVTVTPNGPQPSNQQSSPSGSGSSSYNSGTTTGPVIAGVDLSQVYNGALNAIKNFVMGIEQSAITPNGWVNGTNIQLGTQKTFNAIQNFGTGAFDASQAASDFINSIVFLHVSFWIITGAVVAVIIVILYKIGREGLKLIGWIVIIALGAILLSFILRWSGIVSG